MAFEMLGDDDEIPAEFLSYFETNYVGIVRGRGDRQRRDIPSFPVHTWNVRQRVLDDLPRSNNACEGFHNALRSSITSTHPNIWKLMSALKNEMALSETRLLHRDRGDKANQKSKYQILSHKIKRQVSGYDCNEISFPIVSKFLSSVAQNLH